MAIPGAMTEFEIDELSGVDEPAQKGARVAILKAAGDDTYDPVIKRKFSDQKRKDLADSGKALPDGSFPIENEEDLHNAVTAVGRAKNEAKAKAHIIARAKAMGMSGSLPDGWVSKNEGGSLVDPKELRKALGLAETASDADVSARLAVLNKAEGDKKKAEDDAAAEKKKAEKATAITALTGVEKAHFDTLPAAEQDGFLALSKSARGEAIAKAASGDEVLEVSGQKIRKSDVSPAVFAVLKAQEKAIADGAEAVAKAAEAAANATFEKRAREELPNTTGTVAQRAATLKAIESIPDAEARKAALAQLHAADKIAGSTFSLVGKRGGAEPDEDDAEGQLNKAAAELKKVNPTWTAEKAYDEACKANPAMYDKYRTQKRAAQKAAA